MGGVAVPAVGAAALAGRRVSACSALPHSSAVSMLPVLRHVLVLCVPQNHTPEGSLPLFRAHPDPR